MLPLSTDALLCLRFDYFTNLCNAVAIVSRFGFCSHFTVLHFLMILNNIKRRAFDTYESLPIANSLSRNTLLETLPLGTSL